MTVELLTAELEAAGLQVFAPGGKLEDVGDVILIYAGIVFTPRGVRDVLTLTIVGLDPEDAGANEDLQQRTRALAQVLEVSDYVLPRGASASEVGNLSEDEESDDLRWLSSFQVEVL